jgi:hypothetical protein
MTTLKIEKDIKDIMPRALTVSITDAESLKDATTELSKLNRLLDAVTEERERVTKPLNEALKAERARWKPYETKLDGAIASIRACMTAYQTKLASKRAEEVAKIASRVKEGSGNLSLDTASRKIAELAPVDAQIATEEGSITFKEVRKYEVMDVILLSREGADYILPNDALIKEKMKEGKELQGVRYFSEQVPVNRR